MSSVPVQISCKLDLNSRRFRVVFRVLPVLLVVAAGASRRARSGRPRLTSGRETASSFVLAESRTKISHASLTGPRRSKLPSFPSSRSFGILRESSSSSLLRRNIVGRGATAGVLRPPCNRVRPNYRSGFAESYLVFLCNFCRGRIFQKGWMVTVSNFFFFRLRDLFKTEFDFSVIFRKGWMLTVSNFFFRFREKFVSD